MEQMFNKILKFYSKPGLPKQRLPKLTYTCTMYGRQNTLTIRKTDNYLKQTHYPKIDVLEPLEIMVKKLS